MTGFGGPRVFRRQSYLRVGCGGRRGDLVWLLRDAEGALPRCRSRQSLRELDLFPPRTNDRCQDFELGARRRVGAR